MDNFILNNQTYQSSPLSISCMSCVVPCSNFSEMKGCVISVLKCCDNKNFKTCPASKGAKWQITETTADFQRLQQKLPVAESRPDQIFIYLLGKYEFNL